MVDPTSNKSIWFYHHKNKLFLDTHCFCLQKWRVCTKRLKTNFCELTDVVEWWICMSRWKRLAGNGNACDEYIHLGWLLRGANQPTSKILTGQPPPPANQPVMASLSCHRQLKKPVCCGMPTRGGIMWCQTISTNECEAASASSFAFGSGLASAFAFAFEHACVCSPPLNGIMTGPP